MRIPTWLRAGVLAVALALVAKEAAATVSNAPAVFLADAAATLDSSRGELTIQILVPREGVLSHFELGAEGAVARLTSPLNVVARRGSPAAVTFAITRSGPPGPLVIRYRFDGEPYEQQFDLTEDSPGAALWRASDPARRAVSSARAGQVRAERPSAAQATSIQVHGTLIARRGDGSILPVDSAQVHVMDRNTLTADQLLGSTTAGSGGAFDLTVSWPTCALCEAHPDLYLIVEAKSSSVNVVSGLGPFAGSTVTWASSVLQDVTLTDVALESLEIVGPQAAAFGALATLVRERQWSAGLGFDVPFVTCIVGSSATLYRHATESIEMTDQDIWNQWVLAHEFAHHWQNKLAHVTSSHDYSNLVCDTPSPGHCIGCAEMDVAGWIEGFADWFAVEFGRSWFSSTFTNFLSGSHPMDFESWLTCTQPAPGSSYPAQDEESHVAAFLNDVADAPSDDTHLGLGSDLVAYGPASVLSVIGLFKPNTAEEFYGNLVAAYPADNRDLWRTALNNEMDFDRDPPAAPGNLTCIDHSVGVPSPDATLGFTWSRPADDGSGVEAYSIEVSQGGPPVVDETPELGDRIGWVSPPLTPGSYYFGIRAVDHSGHWSTAAIAGPFVVEPAATTDLVSYAPAGWHSALVPRHTANSSESSVPIPGTLEDSVWVYMNAAWANIGTGTVPANNRSHMLVNGAWSGAWASWNIALEPLYYLSVINWSVGWFRGGLNTIALLPDGDELLGELDETNNVWGEQWAFSPKDITGQGPRSFPPPGIAEGGFSTITDGAVAYQNGRGFRVQGGPLLSAVTLRAKGAMDVDLRLHPPYVGPKEGYQDVTAQSLNLGDLDAILMPEGSAGTWDFSVVRPGFVVAGDSFFVHHVTSQDVPFDSEPQFMMAAGQSMMLFTTDLPVDAYATGIFLSAGTNSRLRVALLALPAPIGITDAIQKQTGTNEIGIAFLPDLAAAGLRIGYAVYREPQWGTDPVTFTIGVKRMPPNPGHAVPTGWYSPLVPSAAADGTNGNVPAPALLIGDVQLTFLNAAIQNDSPTPVPRSIHSGGAGTAERHDPLHAESVTLSAEIRLDGDVLTTLSADSVAGGGLRLFHLATPFLVRGGRHVLSSVLDPMNLVEELNEDDNAFGEAWIWSPSTLAIGATTSRAAPPPASGGWAELTASPERFPNCDGLRMPAPATSGNDGHWLGFAAMPGAASDVDLNLHEASTGAQNGFAGPLASSRWGPGESEYVLANFRAESPRPFDVGIVRASGTEAYVAEVTSSTWLAAQPSGPYGPFTIPANRILELREVWLPAGVHQVSLEEAGGGVDWGLSLHAADSSWSGKQVLANQQMAWMSPAGGNEVAVVDLPAPGHVVVAIWKAKRAQLGVAGSYRLRFQAPVAVGSGSPEATTGLGTIAPNPTRGAARVEFRLANPGDAALEVFDVRGALVRVLQQGALPAGRHSRQWDGLRSDGSRAANGIYFVRLSAGEHRETRRIARVE